MANIYYLLICFCLIGKGGLSATEGHDVSTDSRWGLPPHHLQLSKIFSVTVAVCVSRALGSARSQTRDCNLRSINIILHYAAG